MLMSPYGLSAPNEIAIYLAELHPAQTTIKREAKRFNVLACGRRFGKTLLAEDLIADVALDDGGPVGYFAPTYKYLTEFWNSLMATFAPVIKASNKVDRRLELITGGVVEGWTLEDPNAGRSRRYKRVIVDEAGLCANLAAQWQEAIRPTLADYRGDGWLMGTPKGRNFFYTAYQWGQDAAHPDWRSWRFSTEANPHIAREEIAAMRAEMPERRAAQELDALFLDDAGGVFRNVRACVKPAQRSEQASVIGVDWGRTNDATVFIAVDPLTRAVVDVERLTRVEFAHQRAALLAFWRRNGGGPVIAEANSIGLPNIEALIRDGLPVQPFTTTNASKAQIIDALVLAFEQQVIRLPNAEWLIVELEAYESERLPSGLIRYSAPEGLHDDGVMALALAWYGVAYGQVSYTEALY